MRFRFSYPTYPASKELTEKSRKVGTLTHPVFCFGLGSLLGFVVIMLCQGKMPASMIGLMVCVIGSFVVLRVYRKKRFAQLDAAYARLLKESKPGA